MNKFLPFSKFIRQIFAPFGRITVSFRQPSPKGQRPPELWELEEKFNKEPDADPERVMDRQFSSSIRSGRG
jgi:hypothetical protein